MTKDMEPEFLSSSHRDQITVAFQNNAEQLWTMLEGQPEAQAMLEKVYRGYFDHQGMAQSQIEGINAMIKTYVDQRNAALNELERLEHDIRNDWSGSHDPAISNMLEEMREYADESAMQHIVDLVSSTLEVYDFDATDLIDLLTGEHTSLALEAGDKQELVSWLQRVGERNRQRLAEWKARKAGVG